MSRPTHFCRIYHVYKIECAGCRRYIIHNASAIGNPTDHAPHKWYAQLYPVPLGLEMKSAGFDSANEAERVAREQDAGLDENLF